MAISDFKLWIGNLSEKDIDDIYNLYLSIGQTNEMGGFKTVQNDRGQKFVQTDFNDHDLMLNSPEAEKTFLDILDKEFGGDFESVELQYNFITNMRKDD
jgi:hypothetical protein